MAGEYQKRRLPEPRNNREQLLKVCFDMEYPMDKIYTITQPLHFKTAEEQERMAAEIVAQLLSENDSKQRDTL